jgi:hypothetical protein
MDPLQLQLYDYLVEGYDTSNYGLDDDAMLYTADEWNRSRAAVDLAEYLVEQAKTTTGVPLAPDADAHCDVIQDWVCSCGDSYITRDR